MTIEIDTEQEIITVDGVKISLQLLKTFANPDPTKLFAMKRDGDVVTVTVIEPAKTIN